MNCQLKLYKLKRRVNENREEILIELKFNFHFSSIVCHSFTCHCFLHFTHTLFSLSLTHLSRSWISFQLNFPLFSLDFFYLPVSRSADEELCCWLLAINSTFRLSWELSVDYCLLYVCRWIRLKFMYTKFQFEVVFIQMHMKKEIEKQKIPSFFFILLVFCCKLIFKIKTKTVNFYKIYSWMWKWMFSTWSMYFRRWRLSL